MAVSVHLKDGTVLNFPEANTIIKSVPDVYVIGIGSATSVHTTHGMVEGTEFAWAAVDNKGTEAS